MKENLKKFLRYASEHVEVSQKLANASENIDEAIPQIIEIAGEAGFELSAADFEQPSMEEHELAAVSGGATIMSKEDTECFCVFAGGGTKDDFGNACGCPVAGYGSDGYGEQRCICAIGGYGD